MIEILTGAIAAVLAMVGLTPTAAPAPTRILSLNLCADQYLLALADPGQIVALTQFARDPKMSFAARQAGRYPITRGKAEDVILLQPDLVIASPWRATPVFRAGDGHVVPTLDLPPADSYSQIVDQVRSVARAIGHPERGEALVARMNAELAGIRPASGHPVAAYYQRRGFLTGTGTLVDDIMKRLGLTNLATVTGRPALSRMTLEQMVAAQPDLLVIEGGSDRVIDQGTEMLRHPAIARIPRLRLPEAATVCGGPSYPHAVRSLAAQLRAAGR
jgi:iron complex transport system substrate-binding protein